MKKTIYILFILLLSTSKLLAQPIVTLESGSLHRILTFESKYIGARVIDIWLPADYDRKKEYATLYMHDGQMLFDAKTTWNKQEWGVDEVMNHLLTNQKIKNTIVIGIWNNSEKRHPEFFPNKPYQSLNEQDKKIVTDELISIGRIKTTFRPTSDLYLKFMVEELKPHIDKTFATNPSKEFTFTMGSSMGGLIAMYAVCEYPEVFGGAACMSTHWVGTFSPENNPIPKAFADYMRANLPAAKTHKMYFDHGTLTLDALYGPFQKEIDAVMKEKGYDETLWKTQVFDGAEHTEQDWFKRLDVPLLFLLGS
jgi:predicted alpha/beta superfamily hydrolase